MTHTNRVIRGRGVCPLSPSRSIAWTAQALLVFVTLLGSVATARASHYPLNAIDIASSTETYALYKAGVTDTSTLLNAAGPKAARKVLAAKTKLSPKRLKALAAICDLLQVRGIGPTVARLLQRCSVPHLKAFKAKGVADVEALSACMAKKNREDPIAEVTPGPEFIKAWIDAAKPMESLLD